MLKKLQVSNNDNDRDLGRLEGQFKIFAEQMLSLHKERVEMFKDLKLSLENKADAQERRLMNIENELSTYKTIIKTSKFIFYITICTLAFKFGDVKTLWKEFFGA